MWGLISSAGTGGTPDWSLANSWAQSSGMRSGRVERIWAILMKLGPRLSIALRRRTAWGWRVISSPGLSSPTRRLP